MIRLAGNRTRNAGLEVQSDIRFTTSPAPDETRTRDLRLTKPTLYQLSYRGVESHHICSFREPIKVNSLNSLPHMIRCDYWVRSVGRPKKALADQIITVI